MATTFAAESVRDEFIALLASSLVCDDDLAGSIARQAIVRDHAARSIIIDCDQGQSDVHLLARGHARMVVNSIDGRMVVIEDYTTGDFLGLAGLFEWNDVPAQVCAVSQSRTGSFTGHAFLGLMTSYGSIALAVSRMLVARLAAANRRVAENATLTAAGRIHAELLRRARAGEAMAIRPMPVFAELALALQTTRETVSRTINALEKRGIVRRADDALVIVAPHRLDELIY